MENKINTKIYLTRTMDKNSCIFPLTQEVSDFLQQMGLKSGSEVFVDIRRKRYGVEVKVIGSLASILVEGKSRLQVRLWPEGTQAILERGFEDLEEVEITLTPVKAEGGFFKKGDE